MPTKTVSEWQQNPLAISLKLIKSTSLGLSVLLVLATLFGGDMNDDPMT